MARVTGRLGSASISGTSATTVYTVPSGHDACLNVNVVVTDGTASVVRLAYATTATPGAADWIEYDVTIQPGFPLLRTGEILAAGQRVIVTRMSGGIITVDVRGVQETV